MRNGQAPNALTGDGVAKWAAIAPRTNRVAETVEVGEAPTVLAVGARLVWVVDRHNLLRVRVATRAKPRELVFAEACGLRPQW